VDEQQVRECEDALRAWFTRDTDLVLREVDGLDIGWGGVQRWATARMPPLGADLHLDFACGYGTFLAQLGWRFPRAQLVGLNVDFAGPHAGIGSLLQQAGVRAALVRADARRMPFAEEAFGSVSCFLGLQDIKIGFGAEGVAEALSEACCVLRTGGALTLLDEFPFERFEALLRDLPVRVADRAERSLDVRWGREVAERAIALYAEGWAAQARADDPAGREGVRASAHRRMRQEMERQFKAQGFYVPFGAVRMAVARKTSR